MLGRKRTLSIPKWFAVWALSGAVLAFIVLVTGVSVDADDTFYLLQGGVFLVAAFWVLVSLGVDLKRAVSSYNATLSRDIKSAVKCFLLYAVCVAALVLAVSGILAVAIKFNLLQMNAFLEYFRAQPYVSAARDYFQGTILLSPWRLAIYLFSTSVLIPIEEEIFHRRLLYVALRRRLPFPSALVVSSAIFGVIHLSDMIPAFAAGLFLGWIYEKRGNLLVTIVVHGLINFSSTLVMAYFVTR